MTGRIWKQVNSVTQKDKRSTSHHMSNKQANIFMFLYDTLHMEEKETLYELSKTVCTGFLNTHALVLLYVSITLIDKAVETDNDVHQPS